VAWSNITLERSTEVLERLQSILMKTEMEFWKREAERLAEVLENIPRAVEQYGFVRIRTAFGPEVTLVAKPESEIEEG
jgi:hypothetical protein